MTRRGESQIQLVQWVTRNIRVILIIGKAGQRIGGIIHTVRDADVATWASENRRVIIFMGVQIT